MMVRLNYNYRDLDFFTLNQLVYMSNMSLRRDKIMTSHHYHVGQKIIEAILVGSPVIDKSKSIIGERLLPDPYFSKEPKKPKKKKGYRNREEGFRLLKLWGVKL